MLTRRTILKGTSLAALALSFVVAAVAGLITQSGARLFTAAPAPEGGFYADPYPAYALRLVDPALPSNVAGGTTGTYTWNGVTQSYQAYKTIAYAVTDFAGATKRLGFLKNTTYNLTGDMTYTVGGSSVSARFVLQGDPAASAVEMPIIELNNGASTYYQHIVTADFVTFRKLNIRNQVNVGTNPGGIYFSAADYGEVAYCDISGIDQPDGANNTGSVVLDTSNYATISYSKLHDNEVAGGHANGNNAGLEGSHSESATVTNNEVYNAGNGNFNKFPVGTGWTVTYNIIHDIGPGGGAYFVGNAGATPESTGHVFAYNVVYDSNVAIDAYQNGATNQGARFDVFHNTVAQDVNFGFGFGGWNDVRFHSNAVLVSGSGGFHELYMIDAGGLTNLLSEADYNAYFGVLTWRTEGSTFSNFTNWKAANNAIVVLPDSHGLQISSLASAFNDTTTRDYSPKSGGQLINAAKDGTNIGAYTATSIAASTLVGPGW